MIRVAVHRYGSDGFRQIRSFCPNPVLDFDQTRPEVSVGRPDHFPYPTLLRENSGSPAGTQNVRNAFCRPRRRPSAGRRNPRVRSRGPGPDPSFEALGAGLGPRTRPPGPAPQLRSDVRNPRTAGEKPNQFIDGRPGPPGRLAKTASRSDRRLAQNGPANGRRHLAHICYRLVEPGGSAAWSPLAPGGGPCVGASRRARRLTPPVQSSVVLHQIWTNITQKLPNKGLLGRFAASTCSFLGQADQKITAKGINCPTYLPDANLLTQKGITFEKLPGAPFLKNRCSQTRKMSIKQHLRLLGQASASTNSHQRRSETLPIASKCLLPPQCDERSAKTWLRGLTRPYERPNANLRSGKPGRSVRSPSGRRLKVVELEKSGPDGAVGFSDLRTVWP